MGKKQISLLFSLHSRLGGACLWIFAASGLFLYHTSLAATAADLVTISVEQQYEAVRPGSSSALALHFELKKDWHFYASAKTAPGEMNLKIKTSSKDAVTFSEPIFPKPQPYFDKSSGKRLDVFSDNFTVFLPFHIDNLPPGSAKDYAINVSISIEGAVCSDVRCGMPDFGELITNIKVAPDAPMDKSNFALPEPTETQNAGPATSDKQRATNLALLLALLAGLSLNIMPCVWPVLPIIVMRIIEQAKQSKAKSAAMGLAFCLGILLFFVCLAGANIILRLFYGTVLQWGDQFRNPGLVAAMALLLVVLAMFMFGVFTITIPSSITGKSGSAKGYTGTVGMGFLAAVLSTPCSFAILAAAFAWAQAQSLPLATIAIMVIGAGMAIPYAVLTSMPALLKRTPKPGRWMELFKQTIGFVLLIIAVKLIAALPQLRRMDVLYFSVALAFCVWMWGSWVDYNTKPSRKWFIRITAVIIAVAAGWTFLPAPAKEPVNWQNYDPDLIKTAQAAERPVLIKFTADWCLSCQVVNSMVYHRQDIAKLIKEKAVLAVKADTTLKDYPATLDLKNVYNEPGVPVSILFVPGGKKPVRWRGISFADELKIYLEKLPADKE